MDYNNFIAYLVNTGVIVANRESLRSSTISVPISFAKCMPASKASYSASLFDV